MYLGEIYDPKIICEYYKLADVFVMPGSIGLAINHSFYYGIPVVVENVEQNPEAYYLKVGENGFYYNKGDSQDLYKKILFILESDNHNKFSNCARKTIMEEASIENMFMGFLNAVKYVDGD